MNRESKFRNPVPTVDGIVEFPKGILLIHRKNSPHGWALPGGFVDYGESVEDAVIRELFEETGLKVELKELFHVYSNPNRDPRQHTLSVVFILNLSEVNQKPIAGDDAGDVGFFKLNNLPDEIAFDHKKIIEDYFKYKEEGISPNQYK
ncbi:NUDIX hydrolase [Candidatus Dependentiae bacterium]|nr:NUDIX hydrolase [Candidatus Dependentiae bacterium]